MRLLPAALVLSATAALPAAAQPLSGAAAAVTGVELIDGWRQADGSRLAAIEIRLAPGWHTYWRVPGSAGIPPSFDWSGSANLASVAYEWPRPEVFDRLGIRTIGYDGGVVLPVRLEPTDPAAPMQLDLALAFGVCSDICVPAEARVDLSLAPDAPAQGRGRIQAALAERAQSAGEAGVAAVSCALEAGDGGHRLTARITFAAAPPPGQVAVLEAGQPDVWIGEAESRTEGRTVTASAPVAGGGDAGPMLDRSGLRLTVLDERRAVDIEGCAAPG
jgi:DsbC/DsbD-like thiol-disulfide interchange protein